MLRQCLLPVAISSTLMEPAPCADREVTSLKGRASVSTLNVLTSAPILKAVLDATQAILYSMEYARFLRWTASTRWQTAMPMIP